MPHPPSQLNGLDEPDDLLGRVVAGRFRVEELIGVGGIGRVYRAVQLELKREIALKVLHPQFALRKDMTTRFQREARAASMLSHPNSVVVYDFGNWEGRLFIAMELLEGRTLTDVLENEHPIEVPRIVELMVQLCDVLDVAHSVDLLHRDLKPDNILIIRGADGREQVKVVDFGLAILIQQDQADNRLTKEGTVSGTPIYMSPEQALAKELDARSDIYAVGCLMYELLTGQPPFDGTSPVDILAKHLYDEPDLPSQRAHRPIERAVEAACMWPLQKSPVNRPQTAGELKSALRRALDESDDSQALDHLLADRLMTRDARATAAGIGLTRKTTRTRGDEPRSVLVFQSPDISFGNSCVAVLRAQGMQCSLLKTMAQAPELDACGAEALVLDLRPEVEPVLNALGAWLDAGAVDSRIPVLVVGPDDSFDTMARALTVGASDYVPVSMLSKLPKKVHRAIRRAKRHAL